MPLGARQTQSQRQVLGLRQVQAIGLLRLTNEGLADHLARRAAANPLLRLRLPSARGAERAAEGGGGDEPASGGGLYDHLLPQVRLIVPQAALPLALAFVEALDGNGWLDRPLADIAAAAGRPLREAAQVLTLLQQGVDPTGLFARDLPECLALQAAERGQLTPAMQAVLAHLPRAADGAAALAQAAGLPLAEAAACLQRLRRMDPRPGLPFGDAPAPLRAPDVIVTRGAAGWQVDLNRATLPALAVTPSDAPELRALRQEAEWLANVVERRNRTVLAVARAVFARQTGFLDHGPAALIALRRRQIAADLGLHETTVGRVARDLLVETPFGLRSLCSLFDGGTRGGAGAGAGGAEAAAVPAIRLRLAQLIASENPAAPYGDAALAAALGAEGKPLARRTVAKFRAELGIASQFARRRPAGPAAGGTV